MLKSMLTSIVIIGTTFALSAPAIAATPEDALKKIENDWAEAMIKKDSKALEAIIAADWVDQDNSTHKETRSKLIADLKSGAVAITSEVNGPMTVKIMGNTAIVMGSETEVSKYKGKNTSGVYNWLDVYAQRDGHWVAVMSQSSKVTH